ncbi:MAG: HEAT repeat domain-containing protein [Deltaproteobacteria bacterium]|nr:HEAT repeat domain-containing protein [Deltaproteobacteria bacterium]
MRDPNSPLARDPRTTGELISLLRADDDYLENQPDTLAVLLWRSGSEEFDAARALARSASALDRVIAADILAQFGWDVAERLEESVEILIGMLSDPEERVLRAVGIALGHRKSPDAIPALLGLASRCFSGRKTRTARCAARRSSGSRLGAIRASCPRSVVSWQGSSAGTGAWRRPELLADASLRDALLALRARLGPADEAAFATSFDAAIKACSPG